MRASHPLIVAAVALLVVLSSGCLKEDKGPTIRVKLELKGEASQAVVLGNNTTFVFAVENGVKENATIAMSIDKLPDKWSYTFLPESLVLKKNTGSTVRLNISIPSDTKRTERIMKVTAKVQGSTTQKASTSIIVYVIDRTVSLDVKTVKKGATVYFNYTGFLENGTVFDTTDGSVASSASIKKAKEFTARSSYDPQPFKIGQGSAIKGFENNVMGMRSGEYKAFTVPPDLAYSHHESIRVNLTERIPMREVWTSSEFSRAFRQEAAMYLIVTHRQWNWTCQVVAIDNSTAARPVTVEMQPTLGATYKPYGWSTKVVGIDSSANGGVGEIVLEHDLHTGNVDDKVQVYNKSAPKEFDSAVITEVVEGQYAMLLVERSHHALAGKTLLFVVKVTEFSS